MSDEIRKVMKCKNCGKEILHCGRITWIHINGGMDICSQVFGSEIKAEPEEEPIIEYIDDNFMEKLKAL